MEGWIKIHRKLLDWQWYGVINVRLTFLHLLIVANHKDNYVYGNKVLRGQYLTSYDRLAKEVGITPMELRGALAKLESTGEINKQTTNKYTIITICNYDSYQCDNTTEEQTINKQTPNNYQSNNNQLPTNKNDNNDKNNKNEINNSLSIIRPTEFENFLDGQNSLWFENTKVALREPSEEKIRQLIKRFSAEMIARDEQPKTENDLKKHFVSWCKIEIDKEKKEEQRKSAGFQQTKTATSNSPDKFARNISQKDFSKGFEKF